MVCEDAETAVVLTDGERERLYPAVMNVMPHFIVGPGKRIAQMAMEEYLFQREVILALEVRIGVLSAEWARARRQPWRYLWEAIKWRWRNR